jgi:hypothetical protein
VASHPFRRNKRKGWGTEVLGLFRLSGKLRQERRINRPAIKLGKPKIAIEADACEQSFAGCGIELLRQPVFSPLAPVPELVSRMPHCIGFADPQCIKL